MGGGPGGGAGASGSSSGSLDNVSSMQQVLSSTLVQEFVAHRTGLLQLMLSAYSFLNSETMRDFYDKLMPVAMLYDEMHELPVVQKRKRCMEMSFLRMQLMQDPAFTQILQVRAACVLRLVAEPEVEAACKQTGVQEQAAPLCVYAKSRAY